jgi:hypothetical protein
MSLIPERVRAGQRVHVTGRGFPRDSIIDLYIRLANRRAAGYVGSSDRVRLTADADGVFAASLRAPKNLDSDWCVFATSSDPGKSFRMTAVVELPAA